MKKTYLFEKTTLLLDYTWIPYHFITKQRCFELLIREKIYPLDKNFNKVLNISDWLEENNIEFFPNTPVISSVNDIYPIPSIAIINNNFIRQHFVSKRGMSFDELCHHFDHVCQICKKKYKKSQLSIEHIIPKSKGGTRDDFNITLTCRKCNNEKGDSCKWFDIYGKQLNGISLKDYIKLKFHIHEVREEWKHFFITQKER